ncbi:sensor histidine kinase [Chitinophaga nivalis]|uniref:histidine kinase n=1 Tax=Chitinophaga nivalis TaxID=2991709 RepID=A0ABT3IMV1_9BACT|nr:sensor histidine kinase [Chitinophaga nivalis]MCW3465006.1 sensor histidine kinase [Chitinophaga nivalis]MCW3485302.1 sensor histidine kinase [Chitinophaga nivalis]
METIKDLNFLNALLPLALIVFIIGVGVVFLNLHFQRNLSLQKLKQEALKNIYQHDLLRSNIQAQEQERKRIAHDLHDELGAVMSIMRMHLMVLQQQSTAGTPQLQEGLQQVRALSETALESVRSISHRLMPPQLEAFGLLAALDAVIAPIHKAGSITIELGSDSELEEVPWLVNLGLFRIVMELINNTLKHAGATAIKIDFLRRGQQLQCHYQDDGSGLPADNQHKGLGLKGIEGRVNALGGKLTIGNREAGGFYATVALTIGENNR